MEPAPQPAQVSIWAVKPWWCKPWSIVLTGLSGVVGSWMVFGQWWLTVALGAAVIAWWWVFLVLVPNEYRKGNLQA
jgi:hypothetical protein